MRITRGLLALFVLLSAAPSCTAKASREAVVMVTLEGISLDQLVKWDIPEYERLLRSGAIGLMNDKTEGNQVFDNNAVTIGAGTRAAGLEYAGSAFNTQELVDGERASRIFALNTGLSVPDAAVVHTGIAALLQLNTFQRYQVIPGLLGQQLQDAGIAVRVYGNSDQGAVRSRSAVTIAMNTQGWVPAGDVGKNTIIADPERPFAMRTNYDYLLQRLAKLPPGRSFVVVEMGDCRRADVWKPYLKPERYEHFKRLSAAECGRFAARLDAYLRGSTDRYMLLFVVAAQEAEMVTSGDRLTPVILTGTEVTGGLLTSSTTRRPGLITNLDLAPTILEFFDIRTHRSMLGSAAHVLRRSDGLSALAATNTQMVATFNARMPVLIGYVALVVLGVILGILAVVLHRQPADSARLPAVPGYLRFFFAALMLAPLFLLLAPAFGIYSTVPSTVFLAASALVVAYMLNLWIRDSRLIFAAIGIAVSVAFCADQLAGSQLLKRSILSYDPITGIRFYGIGNECSGVLIGATLLGLYSLFDYIPRIRRVHLILAGLFCAAVVALIGAPDQGTNFGGMLAALSGFGFALVKVSGKSSRRRTLLWAVAGTVILLAVLLAANVMLEPDKQSHIGRAFGQARESGPLSLLDIAIRKWSMNLRLIRSSVWTVALVSLIIGLAVLFCRPVGILKRTLGKHPAMNAGFMGILFGAIVAMLTNDSGVATAATSLLYLAMPLMLMVKAEIDAAPAERVAASHACVARPLEENIELPTNNKS
ncbi:MAG TPA: hypothetical protein VMX94_12620 [Armatimonadota bacterium]|nr:hypothetical protein [Armatimonadota bacterium]